MSIPNPQASETSGALSPGRHTHQLFIVLYGPDISTAFFSAELYDYYLLSARDPTLPKLAGDKGQRCLGFEFSHESQSIRLGIYLN